MGKCDNFLYANIFVIMQIVTQFGKYDILIWDILKKYHKYVKKIKIYVKKALIIKKDITSSKMEANRI